MTDWAAQAQRASRASHDLVGWIYWDAAAIEAYTALGVPDGMGYYVATRFAPVADIGTGSASTGVLSNAVAAATAYSINPVFLGMALDVMREHTTSAEAARIRNEAVVPGLGRIDPSIAVALAPLAERLWAVVDGLHEGGRVLFAAHRAWPDRAPENPALSAWLAVNCLREWRGDTHWALCAAADLGAAEVGLLHNAMVTGYDAEWIARSRGADDAAIDEGWARLEAKGLAKDRALVDAAREFRLDIEARTDAISGQMWSALGAEGTDELCATIEPFHEACLARIDATAGENWMPAARQKL